jgi:hypothetical protein
MAIFVFATNVVIENSHLRHCEDLASLFCDEFIKIPIGTSWVSSYQYLPSILFENCEVNFESLYFISKIIILFII